MSPCNLHPCTEHVFNIANNAGLNEIAILNIFVHSDNIELKTLYSDRIDSHNAKITSSKFMDSGFDLLVSESTIFNKPNKCKYIDMGVKAEMIYCNANGNSFSKELDNSIKNCAFYMFPRSSISKTNLMLANHTGIIDSGYTGPLIGAFRWLNDIEPEYVVSEHTRLVQICHPSLCPIYVVLVNEENELSSTERGCNGFGSTGV